MLFTQECPHTDKKNLGIVVDDKVDPQNQSEELAEDIISLIHSFSGKLYGLRSKIKQELMVEDSKDE